MPTDRARVLGRPIPLLVLAAAVAVGTFSGVGYAATRTSAKPAGASVAAGCCAVNPIATKAPQTIEERNTVVVVLNLQIS